MPLKYYHYCENCKKHALGELSDFLKSAPNLAPPCSECGKQMSVNSVREIKTNMAEKLCEGGLTIKELTGSVSQYLDLMDSKWVRWQTAMLLSGNDHFACMRDNEELYRYDYDTGIYAANGDVMAKEKIREIWLDVATRNDLGEIISMIKTTNYENRVDFDTSKRMVVSNGILEMDVFSLEEFSPNEKFLMRLPVSYDPDEDCPMIKKFVSEIVDECDVVLLQEIVGYCLIKDYRYSKAIMFLGDGSNGKSTFLELLKRFLGPENISTPSLYELCVDPFAKSELYQKLANIHSDISSSRIKYSGNFKMLTGGDMIRGNKKHKEPFNFINYAKLLFSSNQLPQTEDMTTAFWRRWILINFPNTFEGDNCDVTILDKISTSHEMSGMLNWAMEGMRRLIKNNGFSTTASSKEIRDDWIMQSDGLTAFVNMYVVYDAEAYVTKTSFYEAYAEFCDENDLTPEDASVVGRRIVGLLPKVKRRKPKIDGSQTPCYFGISFIKNEDTPQYIKVIRVIKTIEGHSENINLKPEGDSVNNYDNPDISTDMEVEDVYLK